MRTLLLLLFTSMFIGCSVMNNNSLCREDKSNRTTLFKIKSIQDKGKFYIIYAKRNDSLFKILSDPKVKANGEKIKVNHYYKLELKKIFPRDSIFGIAIAPNAGIVGFDYGGKTIYKEKKSHNIVYRAKNLKGLYLDNDLNR